jgi:hypothetical protein
VSDSTSANVRGALVLAFLFGLYFLVVGCVALISGKWPFFLTWIQFDALHVVFSMFGEKVATYIVGGLMFILGLSIWVGSAILVKRRARA